MDYLRLIVEEKVDSFLDGFGNDPLSLAYHHYQLGRVYCRSFAEIELSNHHLHRASEIYTKENSLELLIDCKRELAVNLELVGEYEMAYLQFRECVDLSLECDYAEGFCVSAGGIYVLYIYLDDLDNPRIEELKKDLDEIYERTGHRILHEAVQLAENLELSYKSNFRDKILAQNGLVKLVETCQYPPNRWSALQFLITSYIEEMLLTGSTHHLEETKALFKELSPSTPSNFILKIRLNILEAKLKMISGNPHEVRMRLEQVLENLRSISGSATFKRFEQEVEMELDKLKQEYIRWKGYLSFDPHLDLEEKKDILIDYIENAKKSVQSSNY